MALGQKKWFWPAAGALLAVVCGLVLLSAPFAESWVKTSYDYLFRFVQKEATAKIGPNGVKMLPGGLAKEVVLIQMDNESYSLYKQTRDNWDRSLHTALLNRLADDRCPLVIFDVCFHDPGEVAKDQALALALKRQQAVVLMAVHSGASLHHSPSVKVEVAQPIPPATDHSVGIQLLTGQAGTSFQTELTSPLPNVDSIRPDLPAEIFLSAASNNYGVAWLDPDKDRIARRHWPFPAPGPTWLPSLAWTAAKLAGALLPTEPQEQWLRYYHREGAWTYMSYPLATNQAANYFRDKVVFIGNKPATTIPDWEDDKFSTPYTRWTGEAVGGMEIQATEFLNLLNGDWLRRPARSIELTIIIIAGILLGGGLSLVGRSAAWKLALGAAVVVLLGAMWITQVSNYWFPWLVVAGGQAPCALAFALVAIKSRAWQDSPTTIVLQDGSGSMPAQAQLVTDSDLPDADDYEIVNPPFGEGSYGKVWLARNAIGQWQALKAIYLSKFGTNPKPYEREFNGIRRYKPVSDKHPGLLRVDFVSKKKKQGYFYYVMELGDALQPDWQQDPSTYRPLDLAKLLGRSENRRLPVREACRIAIVLAEALDYLHSQSLTHGDIKPQNIIFVNGQPKLADVGLVNEVLGPGQLRTNVGTPAYMPPGEPPGTAQADIYGLGMVLYVMFTGNEPEMFPAINTTLVDDAGGTEFFRVNLVVLRACHPDLNRRYHSGKEMADALREVQAALDAGLQPELA